MTRSSSRIVAASLVLFVLAAPAVSDVVMSSSNRADVSLADEVTSLMGDERRGLSSTGGLKRFVEAPKLTRDLADDELMLDEAWVAKLPEPKGGEEWACLSEALYFEARGEALEGVVAVAEVILNRVDSPRFPDTVCGVVHQGTGELHQCQFSYNCDGKAEVFTERGAYGRVGRIARLMLAGAPRALTQGATYYHTKAVSPRWSKIFERTATIASHHFYRPNRQLAKN